MEFWGLRIWATASCNRYMSGIGTDIVVMPWRKWPLRWMGDHYCVISFCVVWPSNSVSWKIQVNLPLGLFNCLHNWICFCSFFPFLIGMHCELVVLPPSLLLWFLFKITYTIFSSKKEFASVLVPMVGSGLSSVWAWVSELGWRTDVLSSCLPCHVRYFDAIHLHFSFFGLSISLSFSKTDNYKDYHLMHLGAHNQPNGRKNISLQYFQEEIWY